MPNRSQRRANARNERKGIPAQYDQTRGRGRGGMVDEQSLQEKSRRMQTHETGVWKPTGHADVDIQRTATNKTMPAIATPSTFRQWLRMLSWILIVVSACAFVVIMWISTTPLWLVITVSAFFAIGVLSLFIVAGSPHENPNLDDHGTAV
ncbi:tripartite tricarboxylate transporter TctB family protein [Bifidobacterium aquikefiricola]|uniref:Tripartite tricarboxylate transporter TctB family protein n=1 Tax=Bifidobacterium aquikefiricola TaxID=3059038 RepID=A0AB39U8J5_9BIFI